MIEKPISRIILVGKGAAGKDHARKMLTNFGLTYDPSYTTRPARDNEDNGIDYNFISEEDFQGMDYLHEWYEFVKFNSWYYGTTNEQFYGGSDIFIMTPHGVSLIKPEDRKESLVIYFDIDATIRAQRMSERKGNADSIHRRLSADEKDFKDYIDFDIKITDSRFVDMDIYDIVPEAWKGFPDASYNDSLSDDHIDSHHITL